MTWEGQKQNKLLGKHERALMLVILKETASAPASTPWCSGYHYCTTSFIKA